MAVTRPVLFTSIEDAEVGYQRPVSEEVVRKMVQNCNLLGALAVIGSIRHVQLNLIGAPAPNPDIWQLANGGEITQLDSPLKTVVPTNRYTPDMTSRYVRGAPDQSTNSIGGAPTVNLSHNHGNTQGHPPGPQNQDGNDVPGYEGIINHTHPIFFNLSGAEPLEPAHQRLACFLKIN